MCNKVIKMTEKDICKIRCNNCSYEKLRVCLENNRLNEIYNIYHDMNKEYYIAYAPVGNYAKKPIIIISGKTTSYDSSKLFKKNYEKSKDLHYACLSSIYSNMKDNLYDYLEKIGLFKYLSNNHKYWKNYTKENWEKIFTYKEKSYNCGIQLTQAFNCAILNIGRNPSKEPKKKTIDIINKNIGCMFEHFNITEKLKLIIFLDTPKDNIRYHQIDFWKDYIKNHKELEKIKTISITHPSRNNQEIYNNLDTLTKKSTTKWKNAKELLDEAKSIINEIRKNDY